MKSFLQQIEESFESLNEKDWDGDGKQEKPEQEYMGVKDRAIKKAMNNDQPECDSCHGAGCKRCKNTGMKPEYQNIKQCTKCEGKGCLHCDYKGYHEELEEISTSAGAGSYMTKNAFAKTTDKDTAEQLGYKVVESINTPPSYQPEKYQRPESQEEEWMDKFAFAEDESDWQNKKVTKYPSVPLTDTPSQTPKLTEAMDRKYEQLIEGYRSFAFGNAKQSPEQRVNESIKEVAKKLKEIEETIRYTSRLKTESGIAHGGLKESSKNALNKISERLIKISERIRSLGE